VDEAELRAALAARGYRLRKDTRKEWAGVDPRTGLGKHRKLGDGYLIHDGRQVVAGDWYTLTLEQAEASCTTWRPYSRA
jgi:hypothetical protein